MQGTEAAVMDSSKSKSAPKSGASPEAKSPRKRGATAEEMAGRQRDISVSEFFAKNRHLLGFDNPRKALLTTVKEAVDNSLDACEEAGILPEITVIPPTNYNTTAHIWSTQNQHQRDPEHLKTTIPPTTKNINQTSEQHRLQSPSTNSKTHPPC